MMIANVKSVTDKEISSFSAIAKGLVEYEVCNKRLSHLTPSTT